MLAWTFLSIFNTVTVPRKKKQQQRREQSNKNVWRKRRGKREQLLTLLCHFSSATSRLPSPVKCKSISCHLMCFADGSTAMRIWRTDVSAWIVSYPAIWQNPDADHLQMLQTERNCSIHCKQIYSFYSWSATAAVSNGKQSGTQWVWLGFAVGCILDIAPLKWKSLKPFLKHRKLCFSFLKGTFDYCQHWGLCLKSKSQLLNWLLPTVGRSVSSLGSWLMSKGLWSHGTASRMTHATSLAVMLNALNTSVLCWKYLHQFSGSLKITGRDPKYQIEERWNSLYVIWAWKLDVFVFHFLFHDHSCQNPPVAGNSNPQLQQGWWCFQDPQSARLLHHFHSWVAGGGLFGTHCTQQTQKAVNSTCALPCLQGSKPGSTGPYWNNQCDTRGRDSSSPSDMQYVHIRQLPSKAKPVLPDTTTHRQRLPSAHWGEANLQPFTTWFTLSCRW